MTDDLPEYPHNTELEQVLLGILFTENALVHKINSFFRDEHFYEPVHQRIYSAIVRNVLDGIQVTPLTLKAEFDNDPALKGAERAGYLAKLHGNAAVHHRLANVVDTATVLLALSKRRRVIDICKAAITDSQNVDIDISVEQIESDLQHGLTEITNDTSGAKFETSRQVAERISDSLKYPVVCYSTGLPKVDECMLGGFYPRRMYSFAGRMKDGKSILAGTFADNMVQAGHKIFFLTLEMENEELMKRILARRMKVPTSEFYRLRDNEDFQLAVGKFANRDNSNLIMRYEPTITFDRMKQRLHYAVHNRGVKGFILDQWQLVGGKNGRDSEATHLSDVAQWLAGFCKDEDVFGVVICQLNKEGSTLGSEGIKRAVDQHWRINRCQANSNDMYLDLEMSRYTSSGMIGDENSPAFQLNLNGLFFEEK